MKTSTRLLIISTLLSSLVISIPSLAKESVGTDSWIQAQVKDIQTHTNINPTVLRLSLTAYAKARQEGMDTKQILTIIDYSKPSTQKRLWVIDLKNDKLLYNTWVSHGKNSGGNTPSSFSNTSGSLKSSIGVFVTAAPYVGKNGLSLRLKGLEHGVNDNAYSRSVVIHGANYVNADMIKKYGRIGRSWGCPAVSKTLSTPLINSIKGNTIVFAYYPDRKWLSNSQFLT